MITIHKHLHKNSFSIISILLILLIKESFKHLCRLAQQRLKTQIYIYINIIKSSYGNSSFTWFRRILTEARNYVFQQPEFRSSFYEIQDTFTRSNDLCSLQITTHKSTEGFTHSKAIRFHLHIGVIKPQIEKNEIFFELTHLEDSFFSIVLELKYLLCN